jgi:isoleucyl-tRNA synthetase
MALAVHPDLVYKRYYVNDRHIISLLDFEGCELTGTFTGKELAEDKYHPLFEHPTEDDQTVLPILTADFVQNDKTGIVHIAPAFGADDYALYKEKMSNEWIKCHVHTDGSFNAEAPDFLEGRYLFSQTFEGTNKLVLEHLGTRVFKTEPYTHSYPHNWRTGKPLIYRLRPSWYVSTTKIKDELIAANDKVIWYPDHVKEGRFGDWLRNNVDWSISRERFWGTPLPFGKKGGISLPSGFHKPESDAKDRTEDVLDCWFDSGAMPFAAFDTYQQADVICEAVDQTRGWFYSLLAIGVAIKGESPYKTVLCLGHLLDKDGQKMSKAKGNTVDPMAMFEKYGADAVRWYMAKTVVGNSMCFIDKEIKTNTVINRLLNCLQFYQTYAKIDNVRYPIGVNYNTVDRWIAVAVQTLAKDCHTAYTEYNFARVCELVDKFVDQLSNIWLRANRQRFWNTDNKGVDNNAYAVLQYCLRTVCKVVAPIMPFVSEHVYQQLHWSSVHLEKFPIDMSHWQDIPLLQKMAVVQQVIVEGRRQRDAKGIKLRQPLRSMTVPLSLDIEGFEDLVKNEVNVKSLVREGEALNVDTTLDEDLISEGLVRDFIRAVQVLRKDSGFDVTDRIILTVDHRDDAVFEKRLASGVTEATEKLLVLEWRKGPVSDTSESVTGRLGSRWSESRNSRAGRRLFLPPATATIRRQIMFGWLFGRKKQPETCNELSANDPRAFLADGEEWADPEEWFTDTDGKRVRRKKKQCCGGTCHQQTVMDEEEGVDVVDITPAVDAATTLLSAPEPTYTSPEPTYTPPPAPSYDPPTYSPPSYSPPAPSCSSSSDSSGSSSSSSGSSCSSSSCSSGGSSCGGGGGD